MFVTCERARCAALSGHAPKETARLRGFRLHAIEAWLWAPRLPWAAVTLSVSSADEIAVALTPLSDLPEALSSPPTPAFSVQPTRFGGILLLDEQSKSGGTSARDALQLQPIVTGDWDAEAPAVFLRVTLKRLSCASEAAFWELYAAEEGVSSSLPASAAAESVVARAQWAMVALNCLQPGTFSAGKFDGPTLVAVSRCRSELAALSRKAVAVGYSHEEGFLNPQLLAALRKQVVKLRDAGSKIGLQTPRILVAKDINPSSLGALLADSLEDWRQFLVAIGVGSDESVFGRVSAIRKEKEPRKTPDTSDKRSHSSHKHHHKQHRHHHRALSGELSRPRSGSLSALREEDAQSASVGGESSEGVSKHGDSLVARQQARTLLQQLNEEKEKRVALEGELQELQAAAAKLINDLGELHSSYVKQQQQYWVLMYEAEERGKQLEELRQTSEMTQNRLMRDIAKANEALAASKYTIETNTQKVTRLEKTLRDLSRENRSLVFHVVLPSFLKWILAFVSLLLLVAAHAFRFGRRLFTFVGLGASQQQQQQQTPQSIVRAGQFVQNAQLWMEQQLSADLPPLPATLSNGGTSPSRRPSAPTSAAAAASSSQL